MSTFSIAFSLFSNHVLVYYRILLFITLVLYELFDCMEKCLIAHFIDLAQFIIGNSLCLVGDMNHLIQIDENLPLRAGINDEKFPYNEEGSIGKTT